MNGIPLLLFDLAEQASGLADQSQHRQVELGTALPGPVGPDCLALIVVESERRRDQVRVLLESAFAGGTLRGV